MGDSRPRGNEGLEDKGKKRPEAILEIAHGVKWVQVGIDTFVGS
jgi:hypothetical protein